MAVGAWIRPLPVWPLPRENLPKGIGVYTSVFTLPPGGSSDSEGRAAASPVLLFRCLDTSHTSSCRLTFLELIRNTQFVRNRSANNDRARFVINGIGDFLVMVRLLSSLACLRPSPLVTSRPSRREGESSTIPIVLRCVDTNARREGDYSLDTSVDGADRFDATKGATCQGPTCRVVRDVCNNEGASPWNRNQEGSKAPVRGALSRRATT